MDIEVWNETGDNVKKTIGITRKSFLVNYINSYRAALENDTHLENYEYDLNIQLMLYSQLWESHQFLAILLRVANILNGNGYLWKLNWYNNEDKKKEKPKRKLIEEQILGALKDTVPEFARLLESSYDPDLRNAFAHSQYFIDEGRQVVEVLDVDGLGQKKSINFQEWEVMFVQSVLLSYFLPVLIECYHQAMCETLKDEIIEIERPRASNPSQSEKIRLKVIDRGGAMECTFAVRGVS